MLLRTHIHIFTKFCQPLYRVSAVRARAHFIIILSFRLDTETKLKLALEIGLGAVASGEGLVGRVGSPRSACKMLRSSLARFGDVNKKCISLNSMSVVSFLVFSAAAAAAAAGRARRKLYMVVSLAVLGVSC